ncbi:transposase [Candidatus Poriferisodalis sp.]|uniref:transposase n=1 Tax=Candidatus Poriferisodalis sp. TaxID=3101277 RepID=UPI003AF82833
MSTTQAQSRSGPVLPQGRTRRSFPREFKADAVALVLDEGRTIVSVARALGIGESNLGNWVRQARIDRGEREGLTTGERAELARLRRENAQLRMERDLLKRATAFWVKESGQ